jgi:polar amino acid transport system substrate-binding protein
VTSSWPTRRRFVCAALTLSAALAVSCATPAPVEEPGERALIVASDLDNLPFAGVDEGGAPVGRDVEMIEALVAGMGRQIEWRRIPFETLLPSVQAGLVDVVCATMGITPERAEKVDFSAPYFETVVTVVVRTGPGEPRTWKDLDGRRVAGGTGTTSERAVRRVLPRAQGVFVNKTGLSSAERLLMGDVDGVAMDGPAAAAIVADSAGALGLIDIPLSIEHYALVVPKGRDALREALDAGLADMRTRGAMDALDTRWGTHQDSP